MIFLSDQDVDELLDPVDLVAALARGFSRLSDGRMTEPLSTRMNGLGQGSGYLTLFPAHDAGTGLASAKVLFGDPARKHAGMPEIDAIVAVADTMAGQLVALVEARSLTALRTAATSALAVTGLNQLNRRTRPSEVGLIGTGRQARAHARVFAAMGLASGFVVASAAGDPARAEALARDVATTTGLPARSVPEPDTVMANASVIVTASLSDTALIMSPLHPDQTLVCVGPFLPHSHEISPMLLNGAGLVVSDHPARLRQQWHGHPVIDGLGPERLMALADLLAGAAPANAEGPCLFLSDGRGLEDNVAAGLVLAAASRQNRGQRLR